MSIFYKSVREKFFKEFNPKNDTFFYMNKKQTIESLNTYIADIVIKKRAFLKTKKDRQKVKAFLYVENGSSEDNYFYDVLCGDERHLKKQEIKAFSNSNQIEKLYNLPESIKKKDFNKKQKDACGFLLGYFGFKEFEEYVFKVNKKVSEGESNANGNRNDEVVNAKKPKKRTILKYTLISALIVSGILFFLMHRTQPVSKIPFNEIGDVFQSKDSTTFKLLILPFKRDRNCGKKNSERINYPSLLIDRYQEFIRKNDFDFEIQYVTKIDSTYKNQDVATILNTSDIDLIVWGRYEEDCSQNNPLVSFYHAPTTSMVFDIELDGKIINFKEDFFTKTGLQKIYNTEKIREGHLLEKIDEAIFFRLAYIYYKDKQFEAAKNIVDGFLKNNQGYSNLFILKALLSYQEEDPVQCEWYLKKIISNDLFNSEDGELQNSLLLEKYQEYKEEIVANEIMSGIWMLLCFSILGQDSLDPYAYKVLYQLDKDTPEGFLDMGWIQDNYGHLVGTIFPSGFDDWANVTISTDEKMINYGNASVEKLILVQKINTLKYKGKEIYSEVKYPNREIKMDSL